MLNDLIKLYNTLLLIETKGENTKIMSNCLVYTEQMITAERQKEAAKETEVETAKEEEQ